MSNPRFFVSDIATQGQVSLSDEDARHALGVLRLRVGDRVTLFNGDGLESEGEIVACGKSQIVIAALAPKSVSREIPGSLDLFVSLPKGDRQKQMVDMLVQLGVHSLTPLVCQRSVVQPTENTIDRLRRMVVESSKQCGRNQLLLVHSPTAFHNVVTSVSVTADIQPPLRLYAHPYGFCSSLLSAFQNELRPDSVSACILIGPEGGFTEFELQSLIASNWQQVHLGARILRIETAAIAVAAAWAAWRERSLVAQNC